MSESSSSTPPSTTTSTFTSDSSPSVSDYDGSGIDADTEDSMTTDEEVDKLVDAATTTDAADSQASKKWVNVKGSPLSEKQDATTSTNETLAAESTQTTATEVTP